MSKRIVIVGGGVIGLCCAYYLARDGHSVTLIDRGEAVGDNCSYGNAGLVVPSHVVPLAAPGMMLAGLKWMRDPESPFYVRPRPAPDLVSWGWKFFRAGTKAHVERSAPLLRDLNMASRAAFEELDAQIGGFDFEGRGLLMLFKSAAAFEEEKHVVALASRLGVPARMLSAAEAAELDPGTRMEIHGAAYYPNDCHMSPQRLMRALRCALETAGVQFMWRCEVTGWRLNDRAIRAASVTTWDGSAVEVEGDEWVLCGGSWSPRLARQLKLKLPIQAGKGYSLTLNSPRVAPAIPAILGEARVAVTPMGGALRFAGTMEIAGMDTTINPARVRGILKSIPRYYPEFYEADFTDVQPWAGLRPCSPDGLPYVGRTERCTNLCLATGHAMLGLSLGPVTGQLIASSIAGEPHPLQSPLLAADRYS